MKKYLFSLCTCIFIAGSALSYAATEGTELSCRFVGNVSPEQLKQMAKEEKVLLSECNCPIEKLEKLREEKRNESSNVV